MRLIRDSLPGRAAFDTAVTHALMRRVARGELPPTLRVHRTGPILAFGKLDALAPGFPAAAEAARAHGFEPIVRVAGGRAAVYHEQTLAVSEMVADPDANVHIHDRYRETSALLAAALGDLGVDARVGEIPGEYCPGEFSVNARGALKLTGTGQRVVRGGAHVGTVVVVRDAARVRAVLEDVYAALGFAWRPEATGAVEDELPGVGLDAVERALLARYGARGALEEARLDEATLALAAELEDEHRA